MSRPNIRVVIDAIRERDGDDARTLAALLDRVAASLDRGESTETFADSFCRQRGFVSGYIYETVPIALHALFANDDATTAMQAAIRCGGDTDSVASIVGGVVGVRDATMLDRLIEWPCNAAWLRRLSDAAASGTMPPRLPFFTRIARNALELAFLLLHVARRGLPPYRTVA